MAIRPHIHEDSSYEPDSQPHNFMIVFSRGTHELVGLYVPADQLGFSNKEIANMLANQQALFRISTNQPLLGIYLDMVNVLINNGYDEQVIRGVLNYSQNLIEDAYYETHHSKDDLP